MRDLEIPRCEARRVRVTSDDGTTRIRVLPPISLGSNVWTGARASSSRARVAAAAAAVHAKVAS